MKLFVLYFTVKMSKLSFDIDFDTIPSSDENIRINYLIQIINKTIPGKYWIVEMDDYISAFYYLFNSVQEAADFLLDHSEVFPPQPSLNYQDDFDDSSWSLHDFTDNFYLDTFYPQVIRERYARQFYIVSDIDIAQIFLNNGIKILS